VTHSRACICIFVCEEIGAFLLHLCCLSCRHNFVVCGSYAHTRTHTHVHTPIDCEMHKYIVNCLSHIPEIPSLGHVITSYTRLCRSLLHAYACADHYCIHTPVQIIHAMYIFVTLHPSCYPTLSDAKGSGISTALKAASVSSNKEVAARKVWQQLKKDRDWYV